MKEAKNLKSSDQFQQFDVGKEQEIVRGRDNSGADRPFYKYTPVVVTVLMLTMEESLV